MRWVHSLPRPTVKQTRKKISSALTSKCPHTPMFCFVVLVFQGLTPVQSQYLIIPGKSGYIRAQS